MIRQMFHTFCYLVILLPHLLSIFLAPKVPAATEKAFVHCAVCAWRGGGCHISSAYVLAVWANAGDVNEQ